MSHHLSPEDLAACEETITKVINRLARDWYISPVDRDELRAIGLGEVAKALARTRSYQPGRIHEMIQFPCASEMLDWLKARCSIAYAPEHDRDALMDSETYGYGRTAREYGDEEEGGESAAIGSLPDDRTPADEAIDDGARLRAIRARYAQLAAADERVAMLLEVEVVGELRRTVAKRHRLGEKQAKDLRDEGARVLASDPVLCRLMGRPVPVRARVFVVVAPVATLPFRSVLRRSRGRHAARFEVRPAARAAATTPPPVEVEGGNLCDVAAPDGPLSPGITTPAASVVGCGATALRRPLRRSRSAAVPALATWANWLATRPGTLASPRRGNAHAAEALGVRFPCSPLSTAPARAAPS